jgi:hypothetical protein
MRQHRPVCLEDHVVLGALALAVGLFGDLPQSVALLDLIGRGLRCDRGCGKLVVDGRDALGIADGESNLLGLFRGNGLTVTVTLSPSTWMLIFEVSRPSFSASFLRNV